MTLPRSTADLDGCSREPIHIPGAIQPHGALLIIGDDLTCLQASANAEEFLGAGFDDVIGHSLPEAVAELSRAIEFGSAPKSPRAITINGRKLDVSLKPTEAGLLIEFEPAGPDALHFHADLQRALAGLQSATDEQAVFDLAVLFIGTLTGFERVMMYRFDADWNGQVVAEFLGAPDVDSYQGLHFPASDIPAQARELYRRSWLRIIPNASYQPVPVHPALNPRTGRPLDMSAAMLRSVSPIHLEYLRNMNVAASMSISVIVNGQLWGLIACHHHSPRVLPLAVRAVCEIFGQVLSFEIGARAKTRQLSQFVKATRIQAEFFEVISTEQNVLDALVKYTPQLLEFMNSTGAAIYVNGKITLLGASPTEEQVQPLVAWLKTQELSPVLATDSLMEIHPEAVAFQDLASGLLAVRLSRVEPHFVMWFRSEVVKTVTWAGHPEKALDEQKRLSPRKSFAAWQQTVTGHATPWGEHEVKGAQELVLAINALVLRRTENLISQNVDLERKNTDLNSFAYIAAHDLREPLRGIENYLRFLSEDHAKELSTEAIRKVETVASLVRFSKELIDVLNHYSRLGRMEVNLRMANLNSLVDQVLLGLDPRIREADLQIRRPQKLPAVTCDPVLIREVFSNLLTNALKYNQAEAKWIEIGVEECPDRQPRFYVRDNGIGIREKHFEDVFRMFRRLHAQDEFGGGTGAGLAIVKTIVERHGGRVWIESEFGNGTTIWFELGVNISAQG